MVYNFSVGSTFEMPNDGTLDYQKVGSGPWLVFVHGFSLDQRMWARQVEQFRAKFTVLTYDCRGFGRSSMPTGPYNHSEDLRALILMLGAPAVHLVGLSMGGRIALNYALRWPGFVRSLALISTDVGGYRYQIDWDVAACAPHLNAMREQWLKHDIFRPTQRHPDAWASTVRMVGDYSGWHWLHNDVRHPVDTDAWDRLGEITVPTIAVVGHGDLPDFHRIAASLPTHMPRARQTVVPGSGHLVNLEAPEVCNEILARHLGFLTE